MQRKQAVLRSGLAYASFLRVAAFSSHCTPVPLRDKIDLHRKPLIEWGFMGKITIHDAEILLPGFLDPANDRSLVNIAPTVIADEIRKISAKTFTYTDKKLKKEAEPDLTAKCLRINFWYEYVRAQEKREKMKLGNIIKGATTKEYFTHLAKTNKAQLAWIIVPPKDFAIIQEEIFQEGLDAMRAILKLDPWEHTTKTSITEKGETVTKSKKINTAVLEQKRKIVEMLSNRLQGNLTKKVAISGKIDHSKNGGELPQFADPDALEALDAELAD